ncbi:hypothetical protein JM79_2190 [Gramella sp. Hel_I_59]|uniref:hypothetical protein n=1 Tax=Gramella sp. Hel_I_59 TaxID=1249978 RepID=UPI001154657B|nr:hypothetical protein [Gramella sp. Hel_I_59]TQI71263.1 hypothetical protein JM79_2190 [Gramella sp. Hel_I_59]
MKYLKITVLLLLITNITYAQDYQTKDELAKQIIGSWHLENSAEDRLTFFKDGTLERSDETGSMSSDKYEITKDCDGEKLSNKDFFLKIIDENGISSCAYIEGINYDENGTFSLMTKNQGKIIVYKKDQKSVK